MKLGMQMIANINNVTQFVGTVTPGAGALWVYRKYSKCEGMDFTEFLNENIAWLVVVGVGFIFFIAVWSFRVLLRALASNVVDYKLMCADLPSELKRAIQGKDSAHPRKAAMLDKHDFNEAYFWNKLVYTHAKSEFVSAGRKEGKCILQCLFIPVDSRGYTVLIERQKEYHASRLCKIGRWASDVYSFISLSPIPNQYNKVSCGIAECYAGKVPNDLAALKDNNFTFLGMFYNRRAIGGNVSRGWRFWKRKADRTSIRYARYLFATYLVNYKGLSFADSKGKPNWHDIDIAFAEPEKRWTKKKDRFFLMAHDSIVGVKKLQELGDHLDNLRDDDTRKQWLKVEQGIIDVATEVIVAGKDSL